MKRAFIILLLLAMTMNLAGCGAEKVSAPPAETDAYAPAETTQSDSVVSEIPTQVQPELQEAEELAPAAEPDNNENTSSSNLGDSYPVESYFREISIGGGYTGEAILQIGSWVKASDTDSVNRAWEAVGGKGALPRMEQYNPNGYATVQFFYPNTSIMVFGNLYVKDTTPGDFSLSDALSLSISVDAHDLCRTYKVDSYVEYNGGGKFLHNYNTIGHRMVDIRPNMQGSTWGPVPFVICYASALSPENPDGDPSIYQAEWKFGDTTFYVYPAWTDIDAEAE